MEQIERRNAPLTEALRQLIADYRFDVLQTLFADESRRPAAR